MKYRFAYLDKQFAEHILPVLFEILHSNMQAVAPTINTYEADFRIWYDNVFPALHQSARQMVLMYHDDKIVGYFQFYTQYKTFMMEEIQIIPAFQGTGLFRLFFLWMLEQLPKDIQQVEAYSHKNNLRSQRILEHFGLKKADRNQSDDFYFYRGSYRDFLNGFFGK